MRAFVRAHSVVVFYGLAVALSWAYWGVMIATGRHSGPGLPDSHLPGLVGPTIAAFVVTAMTDGGKGVLALLARMLRWPQRPFYILVLIVAPLIVFGLVIVWTGLMGGAWPAPGDLIAYPGIASGTAPVLIILVVFLLNGIGEETGWRGYMLEKLMERHGALVASLIIIPFWALWHLPVFFINEPMMAMIGPGIAGWVIGLGFGALVISYVYLVSGRSILAVALWHTAYNFSSAVPAATGVPAAIVSTLVMAFGLYAGWWLWRHPKGRITAQS